MTDEQRQHLREALVWIMGDYSESRWCASWQSYPETALWEDEVLQATEVGRMLWTLATLGGCWWTWDRQSNQPVAVPLDEWMVAHGTSSVARGAAGGEGERG